MWFVCIPKAMGSGVDHCLRWGLGGSLEREGGNRGGGGGAHSRTLLAVLAFNHFHKAFDVRSANLFFLLYLPSPPPPLSITASRGQGILLQL